MNVHILATCRKVGLLPYTTLVFKTLRTGFPNAKVIVWLNRLNGNIGQCVSECCRETGCEFYEADTIHHEWISQLVTTLNEPFYLLDTDVIFYGSFEGFTFEKPIAGARIPEWVDEFSGCITRPRLHTSLLYVDPVKTRHEIERAQCGIMESEFTPKANLFFPLVVPLKGRMYFYDTCSMLYHTIGGQAFEPKHRNTFVHLNFGTIEDLVLPRLKNWQELNTARKAVMDNHSLGIGAWREQEKYFSQRMV